MAGLFETPQVPRLPTLLEEVRSGGILIPDFQRALEWDDNQRLTLLDSVAKEMPIGAFLVWRTRTQELACLDSLIAFKLPKTPGPQVPRAYLLDGHQRLATLLIALSWTADPEPLLRQGIRWPIYYDLEAESGEQGFRFGARNQTPPLTWLPMFALLEPRRLFEHQKRLLSEGIDTAAERAEVLAERFKDYQIPIVPLVSEDLDLVTESFVRVNTEGKRMRETNMVRALAFSPDRDIERDLAAIKEELAPQGWGTLDDQILLNVLKAHWDLNVLDQQPRTLFEKLQEHGYHPTLDRLRDCVRWAIERLGDIGVRGPGALPYAYQLVALADVAWRLNQPDVSSKQQARLRQWFWGTTYGEYFTGMSGSRIRKAIEYLRQVFVSDRRPLPDDLSREVSPISVFNYRATRSKALVLLTTTTIRDQGLREQTQRSLGEAGNAAVGTLFPSVETRRPENRVVAIPRELAVLRAALEATTAFLFVSSFLNGDDEAGRSSILERYLLPEDTPRCRADDNDAVERILLHRRQRLDSLERELLAGLGLTLAAREARE